MKSITNLAVAVMALIVFFAVPSFAQQSHWIKAGTNAPVQHALQYEFQTGGRVFMAVEAGYVPKGYQRTIFNAIRGVSNNPIVPDLVQSTLRSANTYSLRAGLLLGKFHVAAYGQQLALRGGGQPISLMGAYFDTDPSHVPHIGFRAQLYQLGLNAGFRQPLGRRFQLHAEVSFARTVASPVSFTSSNEGFANLSGMLASELKRSIKQYGYVPSANVYLAYRLGGSKRPLTKAQRRLLSQRNMPAPQTAPAGSSGR
jgi:hypothetical protein